jgi:CheY-like chemotaxis protein
VGPCPPTREGILVVDDEPLIAEMATEALLRAGYFATFALDAQSALEKLRDTIHLDLLFTDVVMPKIDGFKLAAMATVMQPDLRVLYASGYVDLARQLTAAGEPSAGILAKPYRPGDLIAAVRMMLAGEKGRPPTR